MYDEYIIGRDIKIIAMIVEINVIKKVKYET